LADAQLLQFRTRQTPAVQPGGSPAAPGTGEPGALDFAAFDRQHVARVYALCLRMTGQPALAEDCTQECFISAWKALGGFRGQSSHATWLHRIAVNAVLGQRRRGQSDLARAALPLDELACAVSDDSVQASSQAHTQDLESALARLPPGARDVVVLVGLYGHSHEEAAQFLGIAEGTSKAQLHRGRRLLAQYLGLSQEQA
jgi:RNA polymerase sigma-70 factor (ECF subfamily)